MATSYKDFIDALSKAGAFGKPPQANPEVLDAAELNLGSSLELPPANTTNVVQAPQLKRILALNGPGNKARNISVVMGQYIADPGAASQYASYGPVTGIVEFGSGSAFSSIEFDLPEAVISPYTPLLNPALPQVYPFNTSPRNSATLTVPGSSIRVYAKNDATSPLISNPSVTVVGNSDTIPIRTNPTVFAFVAYDQNFGSQTLSRLKKTIRLYGSVIEQAYISMNVGATIKFSIPAFARAVSFPRYVANNTLMVTVSSLYRFNSYQASVPAYQSGKVEIFSDAATIELTNMGPEAISFMDAVFELVV
jgi:hypothetical protein